MTDLTRRAALTLGAGLGLSVLMAEPARAAVPAVAGSRLSHPGRIGTRSDFVRLTGRTVTASGQGARHRLRLSQVIDLPSPHHAGSERSFNLIFTDTGSSAFVEGIYRLTGPGLATVQLLLSPSGPSDGGRSELQAVINRDH